MTFRHLLYFNKDIVKILFKKFRFTFPETKQSTEFYW